MIDTVADHNRTFSSEHGQRVLANMLTEGGFFKLNKTSEEQAVENFLKIVLAKTGRYPVEGDCDQNKMIRFVNGIMNCPKKKWFVTNLFNMKKG